MNTTSPSLDSVSRRDFIARAGAFAGGLALASPFAAPAAEPSGKKLRVGIVGGRFGAGFHFHEHPDCIVEAVSDLRPERCDRLKQVYRCAKSYESLEKLILDPAVEAVFIATPAPDHVRHTVAALKAGKHVLCAVPAAMTLEEAGLLLDTVKQTGLTYMMCETSYYQQATISARRFYRDGKFGKLIFCESEYHHPGLEVLYYENGERTWRHGLAPMQYPTHCTAHWLGVVTGDRLAEVSCIGWGDGDKDFCDNVYKNPFWNETAFFKTKAGLPFRVAIYWKAAVKGTERAQWIGDKMSFFHPTPNGLGPVIVRSGKQIEKDSGGFERTLPPMELYEQTKWYKTDMLPEPLRHDSGHEGSHAFLTHEFVDSVLKARRPAVDVYEALAYTVPGIIAHQSALKGGETMKIPSFDPA